MGCPEIWRACAHPAVKRGVSQWGQERRVAPGPMGPLGLERRIVERAWTADTHPHGIAEAVGPWKGSGAALGLL